MCTALLSFSCASYSNGCTNLVWVYAYEVYALNLQGCFTSTGTIIWLPQCQWSYLENMGKISWYQTTTKYDRMQTSCFVRITEITEAEKLSFWLNFHHWLHWKLSKWQLPVQPVIKILSKWQHFHFCVIDENKQRESRELLMTKTHDGI